MKAHVRAAFTLVEVLVVIAITALLAGLILSYSSTSRDQVALYVEQAKLAQTIAKAKSLTVSIFKDYNQPQVPCGYGVTVDYDTSSYKLFSYDAPKCDNITTLDPQFETEIASEQLAASLALKAPDGQSVTDIFFLPPDPRTWIWLHGSSATSTEGRISLQSKSGALSVAVSVNSVGQISF